MKLIVTQEQNGFGKVHLFILTETEFITIMKLKNRIEDDMNKIKDNYSDTRLKISLYYCQNLFKIIYICDTKKIIMKNYTMKIIML